MTKKLIALLLALTLCLCSFAAIAEEEEEIPAIENTVSFEAQVLPIGDTGMTISIPADWTAMEAPEGMMYYFVNAEQTLAFNLSYINVSADAIWEQSAAYIEDGQAKAVNQIYINNTYYILYDASDDVTSAAYLPVNDTDSLAIVFQAAAPDAVDSTIPLEILGSLTLGEE